MIILVGLKAVHVMAFETKIGAVVADEIKVIAAPPIHFSANTRCRKLYVHSCRSMKMVHKLSEPPSLTEVGPLPLQKVHQFTT